MGQILYPSINFISNIDEFDLHDIFPFVSSFIIILCTLLIAFLWVKFYFIFTYKK